MKRLMPVVTTLAYMALAACASTSRLSDDQKLALYREHAGPEQPYIQHFGTLNGWTDVGDSALAVWTRPGEAFLLELSGPCPDLRSSTGISFTSSFGRISVPFDKVLPLSRPNSMGHIPCPIRSIRKLDVKALKADEKALRQAQVEARE